MLIIDTSIAVKWVVPADGDGVEVETSQALRLLSRALLAPDLMLAEFANAMWKKVRRAEIPARQAREALDILPTLVTFYPTRTYARRALDIGFSLDHPVYDCIFLALAEHLALPLVTSDRRLLERCAGTSFASLVVDLEEEALRYDK